jgi:hypothetical protein
MSQARENGRGRARGNDALRDALEHDLLIGRKRAPPMTRIFSTLSRSRRHGRARFIGSVLASVAAGSAVNVTADGGALAGVPPYYEPPPACKDLPDGTRVTLTRENAEHVMAEQGLREAVVTCDRGEVHGPVTLVFDDVSKFHTTNVVPGLAALLSAARRIDAANARLEWGWHLGLGGLVVASDSQGREILRVEFSYGRPHGPFTAASPEDDTHTQGAFWYPRSGGYLVGGIHGRVTSRYTDGTVAHVGYYCAGFPIGTHFYFDRGGKLSKTEDYSESDYNQMTAQDARQVLRPGKPPERLLETSAGIFHPLTPILLANLVRRTVYADGRPEEVALDRAPAWSDRWIVLPPGTDARSWFTPGTLVQFAGFEDLPPATLRVSDNYRYLPLRDDGADQSTPVIDAMLEACRAFLRDARGLQKEFGLPASAGK